MSPPPSNATMAPRLMTLLPLLLLLSTVNLPSSSAFSFFNPAPKAPAAVQRQPLGRVTSLDRSKIDTRPDSTFYTKPKFVRHTDDAFIEKLKKLYEQELPDNATILDLCSSHVSHLPTTLHYKQVDVHGMNFDEINSNPWRSISKGKVFLRDFNENPSLIGMCDTDGMYDAVLCTVGIQYLQEPEAILAEVARVLKPGTGKCIISFSNRFFYEKAMTGWIERGMLERTGLIKSCFKAAGGFDDESIRVVGDGAAFWKQILSAGGIGKDPFVAVIATAKEIETELGGDDDDDDNIQNR